MAISRQLSIIPFPSASFIFRDSKYVFSILIFLIYKHKSNITYKYHTKPRLWQHLPIGVVAFFTLSFLTLSINDPVVLYVTFESILYVLVTITVYLQ